MTWVARHGCIWKRTWSTAARRCPLWWWSPPSSSRSSNHNGPLVSLPRWCSESGRKRRRCRRIPHGRLYRAVATRPSVGFGGGEWNQTWDVSRCAYVRRRRVDGGSERRLSRRGDRKLLCIATTFPKERRVVGERGIEWIPHGLVSGRVLYTGFRRHKGCCCFEASSVTLSPLLRVRSA
ncbi:hypothetical protein GW17_00014659 [Ensete ventricosum]|nr:hypothetical protein GW17_00014659 [Ensete ventricosum]